MKKIVIIILICATPILAQYQLKHSVFGGGGTSTGSGYKLSGSAYQPNVGTSSAVASNTMNVGFWFMYKTTSIPVLTTDAITSITLNSAVSGGVVTSAGWLPVTEKGVCWNSSPNPTIANNKTTNGAGTGTFTSNISGLTQSTLYYVRAYATNGTGTAYGNEQMFTTIPTLPEWGLIVLGVLIIFFAVRKIINVT